MKRINSKNFRVKLAVSEIIGTILMLGITTSSFSILYFNVVNTNTPNPAPIVEISGMIEDNQVIIMHRGGEPLDLDTDLVLNIGGNSKRFKVGDFLDSISKEDGTWSLGEKIIYPIDYDFDYSVYPNVNINIIDKLSNSIVMTGITKVNPTCDIGVMLTVDNPNPKQYETVVLNLTATNFGNINASGAIIELLLPEGLTYISCNMTQGSYNSSNGFWNVGTINIGSYATLSITVQLLALGYHETSQFVILLDGSASIAQASWQLACDGLLTAVSNESVFPRDGSVELTIIQFGKNKICAFAEIGPIIVDKNNFDDIENQINDLKNDFAKGWTPLANGFYLADNLLKNSINFGGFNPNNRQVILLVTDGNANVKTESCKECGYGNIDETYGKANAADARNYILSNLTMTEDRDEIDVIAVQPAGGSKEIDSQFLCDEIVWPQPCYDGIPPPENDVGWPPPGLGWYREVEDWEEFADTIQEFFGIIFNNIPVKVAIKSTVFLDPKVVNNICTVVLIPTP